MHGAQGIYLLDIPMIVDTICEYLSLQDILHSRQVSTAWFNYFNPHRWKTAKFVDLSEKHTVEILQNTARIRSLTVDLQDPDLLVTNSYARQCTQLTELHCANFGYLEREDAWYGPHDPRKNAGDQPQTGEARDRQTRPCRLSLFCASYHHLTVSTLVLDHSPNQWILHRHSYGCAMPSAFIDPGG